MTACVCNWHIQFDDLCAQYENYLVSPEMQECVFVLPWLIAIQMIIVWFSITQGMNWYNSNFAHFSVLHSIPNEDDNYCLYNSYI